MNKVLSGKSSKKRKNSFFKTGFSLLELSIVIVIIGILVGGILASNAIIKKFRVSTAQSLTISSPVNSIADSTLWLESSLDKSFKSDESSDASSLTYWYDIRQSADKNNAVQSNSSYYPTYSNSISYIQAVKFDGTNSYFEVDGSALNNTNYTIFVLEQRSSNKSDNYFIGDSDSDSENTSNQNLTLGYSDNGTIKHSHSSDNNYTSSISTYEASGDKPRIFSFIHDKALGKKTYINGLLAATSTDTSNLSNISTLKIGKSYQGQIGEIIFFARALNQEERQSIEDYLGKKWNSTILRTTGTSSTSASCTSGTVTNTGCTFNCSVTAAIGITATTVAAGSGSLTCDTANNFTGSLPYTCSGTDGTFAYTGATSCSCDDDYTLIGSTCVPSPLSCSGGVVDTTSVSGSKIHTFTSSGTLTCTGSGNAEVLVVAGGGAGGGGRGGGGGAGGVVYNSSYAISSGSISVTVGAGGTGTQNSNGQNGGDSVFGTTTAIGGGGGGTGGGDSQCGKSGSSGGSGGGGGRTNICATTNGGSGTSSQGNDGGKSAVKFYSGGGGGGAGASGSQGSTTTGGSGGIGVSNSISGTSTYYGGGGGGFGGDGAIAGTGGLGGGGTGAGYDNSWIGSVGTSGTGGGGGGGDNSQAGYSGGSGIVIIRYTN